MTASASSQRKNKYRELWRTEGRCMTCGGKRDSELLKCASCRSVQRAAYVRQTNKKPWTPCVRCERPARDRLCQKCASTVSLTRRGIIKGEGDRFMDLLAEFDKETK
jgi:hypothetical protein